MTYNVFGGTFRLLLLWHRGIAHIWACYLLNVLLAVFVENLVLFVCVPPAILHFIGHVPDELC